MLKQKAGGARQKPFQKKILQGSDKMLWPKLPLILSTNAAWDGPMGCTGVAAGAENRGAAGAQWAACFCMGRGDASSRLRMSETLTIENSIRKEKKRGRRAGQTLSQNSIILTESSTRKMKTVVQKNKQTNNNQKRLQKRNKTQL